MAPRENVVGVARLPVGTEETEPITAFGLYSHTESSQSNAPGDFAYCLETDVDMIFNAASVSAARESSVQPITAISSAEKLQTPDIAERSPTPELTYPPSPSIDGISSDGYGFAHPSPGLSTTPLIGEAYTGEQTNAQKAQEKRLFLRTSAKTETQRTTSRRPMSEEAKQKRRIKIKETNERTEDAANALWEHLHGISPHPKASKREEKFRLALDVIIQMEAQIEAQKARIKGLEEEVEKLEYFRKRDAGDT